MAGGGKKEGQGYLVKKYVRKGGEKMAVRRNRGVIPLLLEELTDAKMSMKIVDIGKAIGVTRRTVQSWRCGATSPQKADRPALYALLKKIRAYRKSVFREINDPFLKRIAYETPEEKELLKREKEISEMTSPWA